jgi:hypothetical protein
MSKPHDMTGAIGVALILFAIAFNLPYTWLGMHFDYPAILRQPPGEILEAFMHGGTALIIAWGSFALCALLFAPIAAAVARVIAVPTGVTAIGVAAGVTQAIGLVRWVYAVPGLAARWMDADESGRAGIETIFMSLHQFAGVGIGEAIGQTLTGCWLIGVASSQLCDARYDRALAWLGIAGGVVLLLGLGEGVATVLAFDPGLLGLAALVGFLLLTVWLIWTGIRCLCPRRV